MKWLPRVMVALFVGYFVFGLVWVIETGDLFGWTLTR